MKAKMTKVNCLWFLRDSLGKQGSESQVTSSPNFSEHTGGPLLLSEASTVNMQPDPRGRWSCLLWIR